MANKFNRILFRINDKNIVRLPSRNLSETDKSTIKDIMTKILPTGGVKLVPEKLKKENVYKKVQNAISEYEKFTGVAEIMELQNKVVAAQEKFMEAQEKRRELGREVFEIEARLKQLHSDMQNTSKGDDKYLQLCTEEHKLILEERALRLEFSEAEREERELFAAMSSAVKAGHERERAHAERNKYWYIVASIFGTVLGIAGSTINNSMKMAEFRELMEKQMARSMLYNVAGAGGGGLGVSSEAITAAMKTEFQYQEEVVETMKNLQTGITTLANKQSALVEALKQHEQDIQLKLRDLKRTVLTASQSSATTDAKLFKMLDTVHQELDDHPHAAILPHSKMVVDKKELITVIGAVSIMAMILGATFGKLF